MYPLYTYTTTCAVPDSGQICNTCKNSYYQLLLLLRVWGGRQKTLNFSVNPSSRDEPGLGVPVRLLIAIEGKPSKTGSQPGPEVRGLGAYLGLLYHKIVCCRSKSEATRGTRCRVWPEKLRKKIEFFHIAIAKMPPTLSPLVLAGSRS